MNLIFDIEKLHFKIAKFQAILYSDEFDIFLFDESIFLDLICDCFLFLNSKVMRREPKKLKRKSRRDPVNLGQGIAKKDYLQYYSDKYFFGCMLMFGNFVSHFDPRFQRFYKGIVGISIIYFIMGFLFPIFSLCYNCIRRDVPIFFTITRRTNSKNLAVERTEENPRMMDVFFNIKPTITAFGVSVTTDDQDRFDFRNMPGVEEGEGKRICARSGRKQKG